MRQMLPSDAAEKAQVIHWLSGQGLASGPKPIIVIYRTICKKGGRKEVLFTAFIDFSLSAAQLKEKCVY